MENIHLLGGANATKSVDQKTDYTFVELIH